MFQFNCRPLTKDQRIALMKPGSELMDDTAPAYYLDCQLYQRSADVVLGVPFNIASYALLIHIVARMCNMIPGHFVHTFGDVHIYDNHTDAVEEQLLRDPKTLATLKLSDKINWDQPLDDLLKEIEENWTFFGDGGDGTNTDGWKQIFNLEGYDPYGQIKADLSTGMQK
jgi:thymidylate synthase